MCVQVDISAIGVSSFSGPDGQFDVDVFDAASDYVKLMKYAAITLVPTIKFNVNDVIALYHLMA